MGVDRIVEVVPGLEDKVAFSVVDEQVTCVCIK